MAEQQSEKKSVIVSGASGFVGSRVVADLRQRNYTVLRLVRNAKTLAQDELLWQPGSGLAEPERMTNCAAIIHLAGRSIAAARWSQQEKNRIYESRVTATKQIVKQLLTLEVRPPIFVSASAVGIYGNCGDRVIDEEAPVGSTFLAEVARDWELATRPLSDAGVRVANARFGMILDSQEGALAKMLPLFRWGLGGKLGAGNQYWSWIAVEDVVAGIRWLVENSNASGAYNFVSPEPVTNEHFTRLLANAVARPAALPAPKFALRLAMGEMADALLLTSCRAVPKRLEEQGFSMHFRKLADYLAEKV